MLDHCVFNALLVCNVHAVGVNVQATRNLDDVVLAAHILRELVEEEIALKVKDIFRKCLVAID